MATIVRLLAPFTVGLALSAAANAETYRVSQWLPESQTLTQTTRWLFDEVTEETGGALTFEVFAGGVLVPAKAHLSAIADGVAHAGFAYSGYTPSETPVTESLSGFAYKVKDPTVLAATYADFIVNDAEANQEYRDHGVVPMGGWATANTDLLCNTAPMTSLADLKGKRVRVPGGAFSKMAEALGMIPVNVPSTEAYQAQQTGQTDCISMRPSSLNMEDNLEDVTKSVTLLGTAPTFASPMLVFNDEFWQGLDTAQRRVILDLFAEAMARNMVSSLAPQSKALEQAQADGIVVVEADSTITDALQAWVDAGTGGMVETAKANGVADPEVVYARFQRYLDKWQALYDQLADPLDEAALTTMFKDNLTDGIDAATYGM